VSDRHSKLIPINEEANHQIVHGRRLGKTDRPAYQPLDPRAQVNMLTLDLLRVCLPHRVQQPFPETSAPWDLCEPYASPSCGACPGCAAAALHLIRGQLRCTGSTVGTGWAPTGGAGGSRETHSRDAGAKRLFIFPIRRAARARLLPTPLIEHIWTVFLVLRAITVADGLEPVPFVELSRAHIVLEGVEPDGWAQRRLRVLEELCAYT